MSTLDALQWRYAAKKLSGKSVSEENVAQIIEAARLAPTSSGLQPFELFVVTNKPLKDKIQTIAYHQSQIGDCSHLLIFAAWDTYTPERLTNYFEHYEKERNLIRGFSDHYKATISKQLTSWDAEKQFEHAARQVYIAFSFAMIEAAMLEVDSTPMEGFQEKALDELLELDKKGLRSVLLLPLGYRDEQNDWQVHLKKVRKFSDDMVHYIR